MTDHPDPTTPAELTFQAPPASLSDPGRGEPCQLGAAGDRQPRRTPSSPIRRAAMATGNGFVGFLLRTPLAGRLRRGVCLLRYETGQPAHRVVTPVQYVRHGDVVVLVAGHAGAKTWWRHFRTAHDAELLLERRWTAVSLHLATELERSTHGGAYEDRFRRWLNSDDVVVIGTRGR
jgi:hypothetical protein